MDIDEPQLTWLFGCFLMLGFMLAYPAITTAIGLLRTERSLGKLFWHVVTAFDRKRHR
ncbi:MAG: hypothetical protein JWO68_4051 [Actinomycetia bacterium]|jgi:hypothetical protein|nr:hypothetical protein [Actinomycetes bacterium]